MMSDDVNHGGGRNVALVSLKPPPHIAVLQLLFSVLFIVVCLWCRLLSQHRTVDDEGRSIVAPMTGLFCLVTQRHHSAAIR